MSPRFFHLHLVSDATGETLSTLAKAAVVQYPEIQAVQHVHSSVVTRERLRQVLAEIENTPGVVLYTLINGDLAEALETFCQAQSLPCIAVLQPLMKTLENFLGTPHSPRVGGQHVLDQAYFRRIEALNFTMDHDDGQMLDSLDQADIVIVGISRTSKTPTAIYLANRGYKTANVPLVPGVPLPPILMGLQDVFVVGLIAGVDHIASVRRKRLELAGQSTAVTDYVDRDAIRREIAEARQLFRQQGWPVIDVSRRSIEETSASILEHFTDWKKSRNTAKLVP